MKELIKEMLREARTGFNPRALPRRVMVDPQLPKVQSIIGPRRSGKSSLLRLTIQKLLSAGIPWERICYLPLEDERLRGLRFQPDLILQAFREIYPENTLLQEVFFFFDEIQYLDQWEPFINRIHSHIHPNVIITGSNSRLIHTEVASVLRGRSIPFELLPLSFAEYLAFRDLPFSAYGQEASRIRSAFYEYLINGGFPETLSWPGDLVLSLLQEYFNTIMYRDIIDQHKLANYQQLRYVFHRIASNTGKTTSLSKIHQELKSRGISINKNSIYDIAAIAEDVYLYKRISKFDPSIIKRENADKKVYFIDNGMLRALNNSFSHNNGLLFENLVFWQLYRLYGNIYTTDIYYYKDASHECDFILYREGGNPLPVQVTWSLLSEDTRSREFKGLVKACGKTDSKTGILITPEEEETLEVDGITIYVIAAWKWCAGEYDLYTISK